MKAITALIDRSSVKVDDRTQLRRGGYQRNPLFNTAQRDIGVVF